MYRILLTGRQRKPACGRGGRRRTPTRRGPNAESPIPTDRR